MVQSVLNSQIKYKQNKRLDKNDLNHESLLYEITINNNYLIIALGKINNSEFDENIFYMNVYKIENDKVASHIGVFEFNNQNIYDDDDDIDIEKLNKLLLFEESDKEEESEEEESDKEKEEESEEESDKEEEEESDEEESDKEEEEESDKEKEEEEEESDKDKEKEESEEEEESDEAEEDDEEESEEEESEEEEDSEEEDSEWIQNYTKSKKYKIKDNEGGGDCFFAAIRDGLNTINKEMSVEEMREKLAEEVTPKIFDTYLEIYNSFINEKINLDTNIEKLNNEIEQLKLSVKSTTNLTQKNDILINIQEKNNKILNNKKELEIVNETLTEEFNFMNNVSTIDEFKDVINSNYFWADTWAISTIERIMNIKVIILSSQPNIKNVLLCGQLNDDILETQNGFNPDYYIMVEYTGNHYKLILYENKGAITFLEIPELIKNLINETCLKTNKGSYYLIDDFKNMMYKNMMYENEKPKKLFDDNIHFQFYSRSSGSALPGKGIGEKIPETQTFKFDVLSKIPDWRKKLSNLWISPFKLDGHEWNSVEHYYQASKFKKNNPEFYLKFTLDKNPNSNLSKEPSMAKSAGGKLGKYMGKLIRDKSIKIDDGFFENDRFTTMKKAMRAKFTQNKELNTLLKETKDAKLVHFKRFGPLDIFVDLMEVRQEL